MEQHLPDSAAQIVAEYPDSLMRMVRDGVLELAVVYQQHPANKPLLDMAIEGLRVVSLDTQP